VAVASWAGPPTRERAATARFRGPERGKKEQAGRVNRATSKYVLLSLFFFFYLFFKTFFKENF
jgi:hypothetical protein